MTCCNKKSKLEEEAHGIELTVSDYLEREKRNLSQLKELRAEATKLGDSIKELEGLIDDIPGDSLKLIFEKQSELLAHLNTEKPDNYYNGPERYPFEKVMHMMTAMSDEFSEVRAGLNWKYWRTYEQNEDDSCCDFEHSTQRPWTPHPDLLPDLEATQRQIISNSKLEYLQKEWIDIGHFYIQGAIELGITPKRFLELYLNKNAENQKRYADGY